VPNRTSQVDWFQYESAKKMSLEPISSNEKRKSFTTLLGSSGRFCLDSIRREALSSTAIMGREEYKHKKGLLGRRYTSIIYN
jgi:hypothetical protein